MKKKIICILSIIAVFALSMLALAACGDEEYYYYDADAKVTKSTSGDTTIPLMFSFDERTGTAAVSGVTPGSDAKSVTVPKQVAKSKDGDGYVVTQVEAFAFAESTLESVTLPESVTYIGNYAFKDCKNLTTVNMSANVTEIGAYAWQGCTSLVSITIPAKVEIMGGNTFTGCTALKTVEFKTDKLTELKGSMFDGCTALESIEIPASVEKLGSNMFRKCTALKEVKLHEGLKSLGNSLFSGCTSLEKLDLPFGLESMGNFVFADCENLTEINFDDMKETFLAVRKDSTDWNSEGHTLTVKCLDGTQVFVGTQLQ